MKARGGLRWAILLALAGAMILLVAIPAGASTAALKRKCVAAGTASPKILDAELTHPGDRKTQFLYVEADWRALPEECNGRYARIPDFLFQIQDPFDHRHWFDQGSFVAPMRDLTVAAEEAEREAEEEGRSCWKPIPGGQEDVCHSERHIRNEGGEALAESPRPRSRKTGLTENPRLVYRCSPGKAVTHVRVILRQRVVSVETKHVVRRVTHLVSIRVKPGWPISARLRDRGRVPGPC